MVNLLWLQYWLPCALASPEPPVYHLQVLEPDFFQYLSERPMGDGLFYCYRWFLVAFKRGRSGGTVGVRGRGEWFLCIALCTCTCTFLLRNHCIKCLTSSLIMPPPSCCLRHLVAEFEYRDIFRLWETSWAAGRCCSAHFLEFCGLAIMTQFK